MKAKSCWRRRREHEELEEGTGRVTSKKVVGEEGAALGERRWSSDVESLSLWRCALEKRRRKRRERRKKRGEVPIITTDGKEKDGGGGRGEIRLKKLLEQ